MTRPHSRRCPELVAGPANRLPVRAFLGLAQRLPLNDYFTSVLDFHLTSPGSTSSRILV